jgi:hypothetical protein
VLLSSYTDSSTLICIAALGREYFNNFRDLQCVVGPTVLSCFRDVVLPRVLDPRVTALKMCTLIIIITSMVYGVPKTLLKLLPTLIKVTSNFFLRSAGSIIGRIISRIVYREIVKALCFCLWNILTYAMNLCFS